MAQQLAHVQKGKLALMPPDSPMQAPQNVYQHSDDLC